MGDGRPRVLCDHPQEALATHCAECCLIIKSDLERANDTVLRLGLEKDQWKASAARAEERLKAAQARNDALIKTCIELIEEGSPHEDPDCPQDDTCECKLASALNELLKDRS